MNQRSISLACIYSLSILLILGTLAATPAGTLSARAQDGGPMRPPAGAKLPPPLPANKPEPPPIPPEEIIRRFAAKEDEMVRAITAYSFQKSVRLDEIGPDNKSTGQVEIVTQQIIGPDGKLYEKPVRRA